MTLNNQSNVEPSVSNRVINRVMFDESVVCVWEINGRKVNFLFDTGTIKTIVARRIWDECKTPDSVLQPLSNILVTCVGSPVNVIGKGKCNVKINNFQDEIDVIVVDQVVNDCLLGLDVAFKVADVKKCLDNPEREIPKITEQNESLDSDDVEAYNLIIRDEFSDVIGKDMRSISQPTICEHVIEMTTNKAITQTPREINFALRDEVKLQINDRTALNFETVTQPMEYESLKSDSSVTIVQNHCIKSHLKAQSDTVQREYFHGGEEGIRARPHRKPPYILFLFVFRKFHIKLVASFLIIKASLKCSCMGKSSI
ncbi:unnamed protein product [Brachionus calyciflorus]|uniref:Peptidase A2 domain-containing protein n=1 Tax=Brachionus calyciflorus TaxID=104777 RepID=A0A814R9M3_9BILA|nr:unnamed protein product [Brachionus calyciflorus]